MNKIFLLGVTRFHNIKSEIVIILIVLNNTKFGFKVNPQNLYLSEINEKEITCANKSDRRAVKKIEMEKQRKKERIVP